MCAAAEGQHSQDDVPGVIVWRFMMPTDDGDALEVDLDNTYVLPIKSAVAMDIASATSQLWVVTEDNSSGTNQVTLSSASCAYFRARHAVFTPS
jgi:hypothetical protein